MINIPGQNPEFPIHSSGYARVARGKRIGAMSPLSFGERTHIEKNRQAIARYRASGIGSTSHHRPDPVYGDGSAVAQPVRPRPNISSVNPVKRSYTEPPTRSYNPYQ